MSFSRKLTFKMMIWLIAQKITVTDTINSHGKEKGAVETCFVVHL